MEENELEKMSQLPIEQGTNEPSTNDEKSTSNKDDELKRETHKFFGTVNKRISSISRQNAILILLLVICLVILAIAIGKIIANKNKKQIDIASAYAEMIKVTNISQLDVMEYSGNGIAEWRDGDTIVGNIAYEGTVTFGVDFSKISIEESNDKTIIVSVPEIEKNSNIRCTNSIFYNSKSIKKKYDDAGTYRGKINKACEDDLKNSISQDTLKNVNSYTKDYIKSLVEPFFNGYTIEVKLGGEQ